MTLPPVVDIVRIQAFLRQNALRQYETLPLAPFTLFFHPTDTSPYLNYAIPDHPLCDNLDSTALARVINELRSAYQLRSLLPRMEFFEAFAPGLPTILRANGFEEEARHWCMLCTPDNIQPAPAVDGLEVVRIDPDSPERDLIAFITAQRQGFHPADCSTPSAQAVKSARRDFSEHGWTGFLGRMSGEPAGVAVYSQPLDGVTEIAGVATRQAFRGRGIASHLTSIATAEAFTRGVQTACLSAEDERAGRVYQRLGYRPFSILLAYRAL
jgi:ribosomal protein S18 acetylase RimI-like enzyme